VNPGTGVTLTYSGLPASLSEPDSPSKPGKSGELDAWPLGATFDARRQATVLNLLDAATVR